MSNGFKIRTSDSGDNGHNGTTYIYYAVGQSMVGSNKYKQLLDNLYKYCKGRNKKICAPIITDRFRIHNSEQLQKLFRNFWKCDVSRY